MKRVVRLAMGGALFALGFSIIINELEQMEQYLKELDGA